MCVWITFREARQKYIMYVSCAKANPFTCNPRGCLIPSCWLRSTILLPRGPLPTDYFKPIIWCTNWAAVFVFPRQSLSPPISPQFLRPFFTRQVSACFHLMHGNSRGAASSGPTSLFLVGWNRRWDSTLTHRLLLFVLNSASWLFSHARLFVIFFAASERQNKFSYTRLHL